MLTINGEKVDAAGKSLAAYLQEAGFDAKRVAVELNLEIVCQENVSADCYKDIESLIRDKDCKIIVGVSFGFGESMQKSTT